MDHASTTGAIQIEWNNDFLLASMWQKGHSKGVATAVAAGTDFCTIQW